MESNTSNLFSPSKTFSDQIKQVTQIQARELQNIQNFEPNEIELKGWTPQETSDTFQFDEFYYDQNAQKNKKHNFSQPILLKQLDQNLYSKPQQQNKPRPKIFCETQRIFRQKSLQDCPQKKPVLIVHQDQLANQQKQKSNENSPLKSAKLQQQQQKSAAVNVLNIRHEVVQQTEKKEKEQEKEKDASSENFKRNIDKVFNDIVGQKVIKFQPRQHIYDKIISMHNDQQKKVNMSRLSKSQSQILQTSITINPLHNNIGSQKHLESPPEKSPEYQNKINVSFLKIKSHSQEPCKKRRHIPIPQSATGKQNCLDNSKNSPLMMKRSAYTLSNSSSHNNNNNKNKNKNNQLNSKDNFRTFYNKAKEPLQLLRNYKLYKNQQKQQEETKQNNQNQNQQPKVLKQQQQNTARNLKKDTILKNPMFNKDNECIKRTFYNSLQFIDDRFQCQNNNNFLQQQYHQQKFSIKKQRDSSFDQQKQNMNVMLNTKLLKNQMERETKQYKFQKLQVQVDRKSGQLKQSFNVQKNNNNGINQNIKVKQFKPRSVTCVNDKKIKQSLY